MSARSRARIMVAVGAGGAASLHAASANAGVKASALKAGKLGSVAVGKWIAMASLGVAAGGTAVAWRAADHGSAASVAPIEATAAPEAASRKKRADQPLREAYKRPVASRSTEEPTREPAARGPAVTGDAFADELALLEHAHTALAAGQGAEALALLADYDRSHARGALAVEAHVLRIEALRAMGRTGEARRAADRFLREHPDAPQADRVRTIRSELEQIVPSR
jgi:hypothetical protein